MLTKKMFSVFVALSMAMVLSGCGSTSSTINVKEPATARKYEKVSVQTYEASSAKYHTYQEIMQKQIQTNLTRFPFRFFDSPEYGDEYKDGEVLIVKIRVISADEGYGSGEGNIKVEADYFDSSGEKLGSVLAEGKSELALLEGSFHDAVRFAAITIGSYALKQFAFEK